MEVESFLATLAGDLLGKLSSLAFQQIALAWGSRRELKNLENTLSTIRAVLLDAEEQQGKNHELRDWLWKLKDICYDVEDLLDVFETEAQREEMVESNRSTRRKVRNFFSRSNPVAFRFKIGHKIRELRERLDEIAADKVKFHLTERVDSSRQVIMHHREREMTHSFVRPSDVIGRDGDLDYIVELLMHSGENDHNYESLSVIPIVGIGGLGKTTLAKMVYNDERVDWQFELKVWICVTEDFNVTRLTREIYSSASGRNCADLTIEQLQTRLRRKLDGKKFLLVLDDVWNDNRVKWIEFRDLLVGGAMGSKIIVTTRSPLVASIVGTVSAHNLSGLSHKACLSLFLKWAFNGGQEKQYPHLVEIGNEIVKKCGGVPLAVRTLGSLLYSTTDEREWLLIRDNEIWKLKQKENDILPVLKLSYDQMPSYLKQCFAFCSNFPKYYIFYSFEMIQFWMAHGLLLPADGNQEPEDIGMRYMKELWSRSFFQDVEDNFFFFTCKMHDLIHDLALSVSQNECATLSFLAQNVPEKVRHLSFSDTNLLDQKPPKFLNKLEKVRTIFFPIRRVGPASKSFIETCICTFRYLRVLNLSDSCLEMLPSSIGTLKHLRYLDLHNNFRMKKLPDSICQLQNLQTLRLEECEQLQQIPSDIGKLTKLRFLEITTKQTSMPNGMKYLSSLRFLSFFECGNLEYLFEEMQHLTSLRTLVLASCGSFICLPQSMKYLTALETLVIGDCRKINLIEGQDTEDLKLNLRSLLIGELPQLVTLPQWLHGSAKTLQYLYIDDCPNLMGLPEWLQDFALLQKLEILRCPKLSSLPEGMHCLSALKELNIGLCPTLRERCEPGIGEDWSKIAHVPEIYLDGVKV